MTLWRFDFKRQTQLDFVVLLIYLYFDCTDRQVRENSLICYWKLLYRTRSASICFFFGFLSLSIGEHSNSFIYYSYRSLSLFTSHFSSCNNYRTIPARGAWSMRLFLHLCSTMQTLMKHWTIPRPRTPIIRVNCYRSHLIHLPPPHLHRSHWKVLHWIIGPLHWSFSLSSPSLATIAASSGFIARNRWTRWRIISSFLWLFPISQWLLLSCHLQFILR